MLARTWKWRVQIAGDHRRETGIVTGSNEEISSGTPTVDACVVDSL